MILTKEQVEMLNICDDAYNCEAEECICSASNSCLLTFDNMIETLIYTWQEADKKEITHEKAMRDTEIQYEDHFTDIVAELCGKCHEGDKIYDNCKDCIISQKSKILLREVDK